MINEKREIVVIDGQGGGIGSSVVEILKKELDDLFIIAIGTNSAATNRMKKAGADVVATGENAIIYNAKNAKMIVGPIGFVFANSMYGEVSPAMASAISASEATKYFIPVSKCSGHVLGVENKSIQEYIKELVEILK
ncbi:DUF3842 family protein [uncultured Thomasclavelia sp.]|uniref:DUF3842 family protein n=1 Tax=uncultured Thomasclavelia sp. TaxID=3025759 RepID=UPI002634D6B3|nr:DUF3842 family protein [uncultured Thomasclavelia sp.]